MIVSGVLVLFISGIAVTFIASRSTTYTRAVGHAAMIFLVTAITYLLGITAVPGQRLYLTESIMSGILFVNGFVWLGLWLRELYREHKLLREDLEDVDKDDEED